MPIYYCYDTSNSLNPLSKSILLSDLSTPPTEPYTLIPPPEYGREQIACFIDGAWRLLEDHRRQWGWINGEPVMIEDIGPLPEGFSTTPPPPTQAELNEQARKEYLAELESIDKATIRAMREVEISESADTVTFARNKLSQLETRAEELRSLMADLDSSKEGQTQ
jgi:hypothetical protein